MPNTTEINAMIIATGYYRKQGYEVTDVSKGKRPNSPHRGYDLIASRGDEVIKVEVKGCTRRWGIPDPYSTEFDSQGRLVADALCVVYFLGAETTICVIPRDAIKPNDIVPKAGYRFRSAFKNEKSLKPYLRQV